MEHIEIVYDPHLSQVEREVLEKHNTIMRKYLAAKARGEEYPLADDLIGKRPTGKEIFQEPIIGYVYSAAFGAIAIGVFTGVSALAIFGTSVFISSISVNIHLARKENKRADRAEQELEHWKDLIHRCVLPQEIHTEQSKDLLIRTQGSLYRIGKLLEKIGDNDLAAASYAKLPLHEWSVAHRLRQHDFLEKNWSRLYREINAYTPTVQAQRDALTEVIQSVSRHVDAVEQYELRLRQVSDRLEELAAEERAQRDSHAYDILNEGLPLRGVLRRDLEDLNSEARIVEDSIQAIINPIAEDIQRPQQESNDSP